MEVVACICLTLIVWGMALFAYVAGYYHGCTNTSKLMKEILLKDKP